jgi:hypothetical protein
MIIPSFETLPSWLLKALTERHSFLISRAVMSQCTDAKLTAPKIGWLDSSRSTRFLVRPHASSGILPALALALVGQLYFHDQRTKKSCSPQPPHIPSRSGPASLNQSLEIHHICFYVLANVNVIAHSSRNPAPCRRCMTAEYYLALKQNASS